MNTRYQEDIEAEQARIDAMEHRADDLVKMDREERLDEDDFTANERDRREALAEDAWDSKREDPVVSPEHLAWLEGRDEP